MIFNAQKAEGFNVKGFLTFDRVDINIGDGFNGSSGIFNVPVSGIYKLNFSGQSAYERNDVTRVKVYKNGSYILGIWDSNEGKHEMETTHDGNNVSYTWIMKLVKGDKLKLYSKSNLYASSNRPLTFTGELIHIEN